MKQLGLALHNFHDVYNRLPAGAENAVFPQPNPTGNTATILGTSWLVYILPYVEQEAIYRQYNFALPYNDAANGLVGANVVPIYYCPSGPRPTQYLDPNTNVTTNPSTHYYGVMGPGGATDNTTYTVGGVTYTYRIGDSGGNGAWSGHGMLSHFRNTAGSISTNRYVRFTDVIDGLSGTLMVGEMSPTLPSGQANQYRTWIRGNNGGSGATKNVRYPINSTFYNGSNNFNDISMGSNHTGGCNFLLGDGSVRFITQNIDLSIYIAVSSIDVREVASLN